MSIELTKTELLAMAGLKRSGWTFDPETPTVTTDRITITQPADGGGPEDAANTECLAELGWDIELSTETFVLSKDFTS